MTASSAPSERLAAAARALAAAEEAVRRPSAGSTGPTGEPTSEPARATGGEVAVATELAAEKWVDDRPADGPDPDSPATHLDFGASRHGGGDAGTPLDSEGARQVVLRQLAMGPRTRRQLTDKLRAKGCEDDTIAEVLDRMAAVGLVDDRAYAEMLVRSKQAGRGLAKRALAQELRTKGVDDGLVSAALGAINPESERARAEQLVAKKLRTMAGLEPLVQARRLSGMLTRKGYQPGVVYAVVRDAVNAAPEHQRD